VGTANVDFRVPACLTFYCGAAREGALCHTQQAPSIRARVGSGNRSGDSSGGDHIPNTIAFASVYHPESSGAVGRANRIIFSAISKTLFGLRKGKWVDELPRVVWSQNITTFRATCYTPFRLL
jgi:hypothetical protein